MRLWLCWPCFGLYEDSTLGICSDEMTTTCSDELMICARCECNQQPTIQPVCDLMRSSPPEKLLFTRQVVNKLKRITVHYFNRISFNTDSASIVSAIFSRWCASNSETRLGPDSSSIRSWYPVLKPEYHSFAVSFSFYLSILWEEIQNSISA